MKQLISAVLMLLLFFTATAQEKPEKDFFATDQIQEINIDFEESNWRYLLDSLRSNGDGLLLANVTINGETFNNAGVRYRNTRSFKPGKERNSLHIKLNYINRNHQIQGQTVIKLSNSLRDPSMVREVLSYEIARDYMPAPRANYAEVSINGEKYGLLVNVENIGNEFLHDAFGDSNGAFFKVNNLTNGKTPDGCKNNIYGSLEFDAYAKCYLNNFIMISDGGFDYLMELSQTLNEQPQAISTVLDVDYTLWMLAFNNVLVNLDSYSGQHSQNYYLYRNPQGKFVPIIWDMNLSFGSFKNTGNGGSDLSIKELQRLPLMLNADNETKPLLNKLLANDMYKKTYLSHARELLHTWFASGKYADRAKELQRLIQVPFSNDPHKKYTFTEFQDALTKTTGTRSKIPGIIELMEARVSYLKKTPELAVIPSDISEVAMKHRKQFSTEKMTEFQLQATVGKYPKRVWVWYRFDENEPFQAMLMHDDGKHHDGAANDGKYGVSIRPDNMDSIEYYIQAENASIVSYAPANYHQERFEASLTELNK